jgi:NAD(P)-dependent dehydrogenase (short-subunit alcohol dehydrogenase family)
MVALTEIQASNSRIESTYTSGLVAVFVGATAGIGSYALKEFAHRASKPRIYFIGRSQASADKVLNDLKAVDPEGEYIFLQGDTSVMRNVDDMCRQITSKESAINVLFMSQGGLKLTGSTYLVFAKTVACTLILTKPPQPPPKVSPTPQP